MDRERHDDQGVLVVGAARLTAPPAE